MTWTQIGDLARYNQLGRNTAQLHRALERHSTELVQGRVQDPARALRGDLAPLQAIETRLHVLGTLQRTTQEAAQRLDIAQTALGRIDQGLVQMQGTISAALLQPGPGALTRAAALAEDTLADTISALNTRNAGQSVFGGATTGRPLAPAADLLAALRATVTGVTAPADIAALVEDFFLTPGGAFDTQFNQVTLGQSPLIDSKTTAPPAPTADDPALRRTFVALSLAALAGDATQDVQRRDLATRAATALSRADGSLTNLRATVGHGQETLSHHETRLRSEKDALSLAREGLLGVDPYDAAARLESTRAQIETLYTLTARLSRLSLTEYLR